jgi:hypothetical protein
MIRRLQSLCVSLFVVTVPFVFVGGGCGSSVSAYCEKLCECVGCNESERAECEDEISDSQRVAEEAGCGSQFDDALSCVDAEFVCTDGAAESDGCDSELDALAKCGDGGDEFGGLGNDPCQDATLRIEAKFVECGIETTGGGEAGECTDEAGASAQQIAGCVEAASCEALRGEDLEGATAYSECVLAE